MADSNPWRPTHDALFELFFPKSLPIPQTIRAVIDEKAREYARKDYEQRKAAGIAAPGEGPDVFPLVLDYTSIDKMERLGSDLTKRGWTTARVEKLLGGNLLRLYADAWGA